METNTTKKEFKFHLMMILDYSDERQAKAIFKHGNDWPLYRDHGFALVNVDQYKALIDAGEIPDGPDYWRVKKGYGLILYPEARKFSTTYDQLKQGLCDFRDGWDAALKK